MVVDRQVSIENARIGFKNFKGAEGPYNKSGDRNFAIFLDPELAQHLSNEGWNIKFPKEREFQDGEDERDAHLPVEVSFKFYPPKVILVSGDNVSPLNEDSIEMLDWAEIENVDVVVRPYNWTMNGKSGVKAYLKAIYVTIETDAFSNKYGM